ncbi:ATP synthase subunit I [Bacillus sp. FJAT-49736]|uniref:ATP synthase subunit I n=1 Tax=Bacillus sp. FJAT-49736 TaxID=2833582 RepID=UPI001BCA40EB|nr:ATP synthase subunit I [Bacillus sp. FJAT-49736]MBS4175423.1 ATP synthase subunit I [Bacillus sp. FJAT-49736]
MPELQQLFNRHRKIMLFLLSLLVLGWGFTPYHSIFLGLILGTSVSLYNHWLTMRKTKRFSDAVVSEKRPAKSLGTLVRMGTSVISVLIALRYPDIFNVFSVILGLMTSHVVIMIDFIFLTIQSHKSGK